jgi:hypothetical protein
LYHILQRLPLPSYDTVNCWLPVDNLTEAQLERLLNTLDNVSRSESTKWGKTIWANLENLKISINQNINRISINGSLCKFFYGNNLQSLTYRDVKFAIEKLSEGIHLPMANAEVTRLDIAHNFSMNHPVPLYLSPLGIVKYHHRLEEPNTLYYKGTKQVLAFYDKNKELKAHKEAIPAEFKQTNLLRYEQRYMKQVNKQLQQEVNVGILTNEKFYRELVNGWQSAYNRIPKDRKLSLKAEGFNIISNLTDFCGIALLYQSGGERAALELVDRERKLGKYTGSQVKRVRDKIKQFASLPGFTTENEQMEELNAKMQEVIENLN